MQSLYYPAENELQISTTGNAFVVLDFAHDDGDYAFIPISVHRLPTVIEYLKQCLAELRNKPQPEA